MGNDCFNSDPRELLDRVIHGSCCTWQIAAIRGSGCKDRTTTPECGEGAKHRAVVHPSTRLCQQRHDCSTTYRAPSADRQLNLRAAECDGCGRTY
jgi:hypothetical protein